MKKLLFLLLIPVFASADRLGSLRSSSDVLLSTQAQVLTQTNNEIGDTPGVFTSTFTPSTASPFPASLITHYKATPTFGGPRWVLTSSTATYWGNETLGPRIEIEPKDFIVDPTISMVLPDGQSFQLRTDIGLYNFSRMFQNVYGITTATLTITSIATGNQCLHADASGFVTGTGSDCGSGGGVGASSLEIMAGGVRVTSPTATANFSAGAGILVAGTVPAASTATITYRVDTSSVTMKGPSPTTADFPDSTNRRYITDAQQTVLGNTSGTNSGDQTIALTGDVTGSGTGSFTTSAAALQANIRSFSGPVTVTGSSLTITGPRGLLATYGVVGATVTANNVTSTVVKADSNHMIAAAAAADVVSLFSTCSGTQYLGADGVCHNASGTSFTVSSFTVTGAYSYSVPAGCIGLDVWVCGAGGSGGGGNGQLAASARGGGTGGGGGACMLVEINCAAIGSTLGGVVGTGAAGGGGGSVGSGTSGTAGTPTSLFTIAGSTWAYVYGGGAGKGNDNGDRSGGTGGGWCGVGTVGGAAATAGGCPATATNAAGFGGGGGGSTTTGDGKSADYGGAAGGAGRATAAGNVGGVSARGGGGGGGAGGCLAAGACSAGGAGGASGNMLAITGGGGAAGTSGATGTAGLPGTDGIFGVGGYGGGAGGSDVDSNGLIGGAGGYCGGGGGGGGAGTSVGGTGGTGGAGCVIVVPH